MFYSLSSLLLTGLSFSHDSIRFSDALAPLSDDEGVDSDAEDEHSSESGDDSGDEKENVRYSNGYTNERQEEVETDSITADCFPDKVSVAALMALEESRRKQLVEDSLSTIGPEVEEYVEACIKMSSLLNGFIAVDENKLEQAVFQCCDQYLSAAFQNCSERPMRVLDRILVRLGLIKSEDKTVKPVSDVRPLLKVLGNALKQSYYPQNTRKVVRAMVGKSSKIWDRNVDLQNQLLRMLY